ncbi:MAG: DUF2628 domain-containing protein [Alphaproteobacteria bacterium]
MMRAWQVLRRPAMPGRDPDVVLVKDGVCWPALFVPVLWGLFRQQWLFVLAFLALSLTLVAAAVLGLDPLTEAALTVLANVAAALFANDWRTWRLEAQGYRLVAVIGARSHDEAERRWFLELAEEAVPPAGPVRKPWLPMLDGA